jgi:glycosyltransferase involved in cell wall biosynthesis
MTTENHNRADEDPGFVRKIWRSIYRPFMRFCWRSWMKIQHLIRPRVGMLQQYRPRTLSIPASYLQPIELTDYPLISVVTASLNQGEFIERTINSVLSQNYPRMEYIIRDGASTDDTVSILQRYDPQVVDWCSQADKGQTDALNEGFARANGDIMAYLNADDLLLPGTLHYVAAYFQQHPDIDVVYGQRILIDEQDRDIGKWILPPHEDEVLRWVDYVPQETLFWRRSLWDRVGSKLDTSFDFAMDWDLLLRFIDAGAHFARLPRYLGAFRVHPQQKTSSVLQCQGRHEMGRLHKRYHGREVSMLEIRSNTLKYLLKQVIYDMLVRTVDSFRPGKAIVIKKSHD